MKNKMLSIGLILLVIPMLLAYQSGLQKISIVDKKISWGYKKGAGRSVDAIIIHSTYNASGTDSFSVQGVLDQFKSYGVASHYLIDREGKIYRLVDERNIAFHAGNSSLPDGRVNVNTTSIGIEIITTLYTSPSEAQYKSVAGLVKDIQKRRVIKYIKGHNEIAPGRKSDPWNFDWTKFNSLIE
ncbi:MAG: N-acetylmuramoyl-L-alanine amidase [Bacteroidetes bacterium]|nr:N-acetylmuramoyl-L-alanine amidase [Bacteroidota bacterium]